MDLLAPTSIYGITTDTAGDSRSHLFLGTKNRLTLLNLRINKENQVIIDTFNGQLWNETIRFITSTNTVDFNGPITLRILRESVGNLISVGEEGSVTDSGIPVNDLLLDCAIDQPKAHQQLMYKSGKWVNTYNKENVVFVKDRLYIHEPYGNIVCDSTNNAIVLEIASVNPQLNHRTFDLFVQGGNYPCTVQVKNQAQLINGQKEFVAWKTGAYKLIADSDKGGWYCFAYQTDKRTETIESKNSPYTIQGKDDNINCDCKNGAISIYLEDAKLCKDREVTIKKIDSTANIVSIIATDGQGIDDAKIKVLNVRYRSLTIYSDGATWFIKSAS